MLRIGRALDGVEERIGQVLQQAATELPESGQASVVHEKEVAELEGVAVGESHVGMQCGRTDVAEDQAGSE